MAELRSKFLSDWKGSNMKYREINSLLSRRTLGCLSQQLFWSSIDEENILALMKWVHWVKNRDADLNAY